MYIPHWVISQWSSENFILMNFLSFSLKWFLWHGNTSKALDILESFDLDLGIFSEDKKHKKYALWKAVDEFYEYIQANASFIPNYGERYRHGEAVSSAPAESAVNEVISRRMAKKQQMRWTKEGAHSLLQVRTKVLNNELMDPFKRWYPKMNVNANRSLRLAA
ncbi:MAG: hypothetical protein EBT45_07690 [Alphaproteobacteria bacterium]|nr:hypothetical protein [Alphaproteobacteria bacterium]